LDAVCGSVVPVTATKTRVTKAAATSETQAPFIENIAPIAALAKYLPIKHLRL